MRELIRAQRTVKQAMHAGNKTLAFAGKLEKADNKTRLKLVGKVVGLVALAGIIIFIKSVFDNTKNSSNDMHQNGEMFMRGFIGMKDQDDTY